MRIKYPSPRPTENQVNGIKYFCRDTSTPLPELEYMTKGEAGKWLREHREKHHNSNKVVAQISITQVITTYANGTMSIESSSTKLK